MAPSCPTAGLELLCNHLHVIPNLCSQTHTLLHWQQQLPLAAVGNCFLLPLGLTDVSLYHASEGAVLCRSGGMLDNLAKMASSFPTAALQLICDQLRMVPSLCSQTNTVLDLQQQLPLAAVGNCFLLPPEITGMSVYHVHEITEMNGVSLTLSFREHCIAPCVSTLWLQRLQLGGLCA